MNHKLSKLAKLGDSFSVALEILFAGFWGEAGVDVTGGAFDIDAEPSSLSITINSN